MLAAVTALHAKSRTCRLLSTLQNVCNCQTRLHHVQSELRRETRPWRRTETVGAGTTGRWVGSLRSASTDSVSLFLPGQPHGTRRLPVSTHSAAFSSSLRPFFPSRQFVCASLCFFHFHVSFSPFLLHFFNLFSFSCKFHVCVYNFVSNCYFRISMSSFSSCHLLQLFHFPALQ